MEIRAATKSEFETAVQWAADEGWNPGLEDLDAFFAADPTGFLMGFEDKEPISSISVVRYGGTYGFLGFYIVSPEKRNTGAGLAIWKAGLDYLKGRTVGLDGVVAQQGNYEKFGFVNAGRNVRFSGKPAIKTAHTDAIRPISPEDVPKILEWEKDLFPADRSVVLSAWLSGNPKTRTSRAVWKDGQLLGYGTIRKCIHGYKIGPLFSENDDVADLLFRALAEVADREEVVLDVPERNEAAVQLAERFNLEPIFETARMYRGERPQMDIKRQYGITTFELG